MIGGLCDDNAPPIKCEECRFTFANTDCFARHKKTTCNKVHYCEICEKSFRTKPGQLHRCGNYNCKICKQIHGKNEGCFVQPLKDKIFNRPKRIIAYDFEVGIIIYK